MLHWVPSYILPECEDLCVCVHNWHQKIFVDLFDIVYYLDTDLAICSYTQEGCVFMILKEV